ncbi:TRAP transporter substrate-binding protein [Candidatus Magnetomoraceae bacterium gMMP-13]
MKKIKFMVIIMFVIMISLSLIPVQAEAKKKKKKNLILNVPTCYATNLPGLGTTIKWVADTVESCKKRMRIKVYEPGKLVAPFEILDAVSKGQVNGGYSISGYWEKKIPGISIFSTLPFGPEAGEFLAWMYYGNGRKLYQEMYDTNGFNVHVIPCGIIAPETGGWYKEPINTLADIKKLKIRFYGMGGKVLSKLGASVSLIAAGDILPSLEKEAINSTEFSMPAIDTLLGFHKVAKYNYFPGWHQQATFFELLINKDFWNTLSGSQKAVLETVCKAATLDSFAYTEFIQAKVMKENVEKHGVEIRYLPDDLLVAFEKAWLEVVEDISAESPFFKKVWDDLSAFRSTYDLWENHAFLPRGGQK